MNKPSVTVVIPTYYNPITIKKTLISIKSQILQPKEIIIVDNSPDKKSQKTILDLKKKLNLNIKYFSKRLNPDQSRNFAVGKSKSKWIAFIDDDDEWKKNYLSYNFSKIDYFDLDFTYTNINIINENNKKISYVNLPHEIDLKSLFVFNHGFFCSNLILKKSCFDSVKGFDTKAGSADKDLALKLSEKKFEYQIIKKFLVDKRTSNVQWSKNYKSMLRNNINFFIKYKSEVSIFLKLLLIKKIIKLAILSKLN